MEQLGTKARLAEMPKGNRGRFWLIALVFGSIEFLMASPTGTIRGLDKDPSGAVVPGVKITLTNLATNARLTLTTDTNGAYQFPQLPPASYSLVAEATGFKKASMANVLVEADQVTRADIAFEIGSLTEAVEVASVATLLESDKSTLSSVVESRIIANMPLNARQFLDLALLTAETAPAAIGKRSGGFNVVAQRGLPQYGVLLGGSVDAPVIINNSRYRILAYALMFAGKANRGLYSRA